MKLQTLQTNGMLGLALALGSLCAPVAKADISNFTATPFNTGHSWAGNGATVCTPCGYSGIASSFTVTSGYTGLVTVDVPLSQNSFLPASPPPPGSPVYNPGLVNPGNGVVTYDPYATVELLSSDPTNGGLPGAVLGSGNVMILLSQTLSSVTFDPGTLSPGQTYWVAVLPENGDPNSGFFWAQNPNLLEQVGFTGDGSTWGGFGGVYPGEFDVVASGLQGYPGVTPTPEPAQFVPLTVFMVGLACAVWWKRKSAIRQ